MEEQKKIIFSGAQPSGQFTLGNYLGALKNWQNLQNDYNCIYCIVDLHSITVRQEPKKLRKQSKDALIQLLAIGLDPEKCLIYFQSHVSGHAELAWILNCYTYLGELNRMTQFKEKSSKHAENINAGLFTYPVLMASDILLYQTHLVPVGEDQRQHLEITRDIAIRMNNLYGNVFVVPEAYIPKQGAKIMSLQEPSKKMSKSDENQNNVIYLLDEPNVIKNKIKRAITDLDNRVTFDEQEKPGISNLLSIYSSATGKSIEQLVNEFDGSGYGDFKKNVSDAIIESILPIQNRFRQLSDNSDYIENIIKVHAQKANNIASKTISKIYKKIGFVEKYGGWNK